MAETPAQGSNGTIIVVALGVLLLSILSSFSGFLAYSQGWIQLPGLGSAAAATLAPAATTAPDTLAPDASQYNFSFDGVSIPCATSYKRSLDQYNTAVPPFDPTKCADEEMEANCTVWKSIQQGSGANASYQWRKTGNVDGCVPVQPDVVGVARGTTYVTDAGEVQLNELAKRRGGGHGGGGGGEGGGINVNQSASGDPAPPAVGIGYGKDGRWRSAKDARNVVALARSGKLSASRGRTLSGAGRRTSAAVGGGRRVTAAKAPPAPYEAPAYAESAPYQTGMVAYSMI